MTTAAKQMAAKSVCEKAMDESIGEVFRLMVGIECAPCSDCPTDGSETISAVIGLAGAMSGICVLRSDRKTAMRMAAALTGLELTTLDDTVKDAVSEICNVVAGTWKGRIPALGSDCILSAPTVVTGNHYQLHVRRPQFRVEHCYQSEDSAFSFAIVCESME